MYAGQRPSSIKTRIKTLLLGISHASQRVRDHLPLKQGLRLISLLAQPKTAPRQRPSSIKTRIKTLSFPQAQNGL